MPDADLNFLQSIWVSFLFESTLECFKHKGLLVVTKKTLWTTKAEIVFSSFQILHHRLFQKLKNRGFCMRTADGGRCISWNNWSLFSCLGVLTRFRNKQLPEATTKTLRTTKMKILSYRNFQIISWLFFFLHDGSAISVFMEVCMRGYGGDGLEISGILYHFVFLVTLEPTKTLYEVRKV